MQLTRCIVINRPNIVRLFASVFPWKWQKRAVGISVLIIRPRHLLKKLLPAAVKESQTSLCFSSSIEQLQLSGRERQRVSSTLWSPLHAFILPPKCPTMAAVGSAVSPPRKHLRLDYKQITVAGQSDKASLCYIHSYPATLRRSPSSADLVLTELPVWSSPRCFQHHVSAVFENMPSLFM